jgi:hypothetical protein
MITFTILQRIVEFTLTYNRSPIYVSLQIKHSMLAMYFRLNESLDACKKSKIIEKKIINISNNGMVHVE